MKRRAQPKYDEMKLYSPTDAAGLLGLQPRTLERHRREGTGPRFIRISATCVRYRRRDLLQWIEEREAV